MLTNVILCVVYSKDVKSISVQTQQILFIINSFIFQPISCHPQVHNWPLKHNDEEIYFM